MIALTPLAWRVECRWTDRSKGGEWRLYSTYASLMAAEQSHQAFVGDGDIEARIVPLYAAPTEPRDDTALLRQALILCEQIEADPHRRGSVNGTAAQLGYAIRARLDDAPQPARAPMTDEEVLILLRSLAPDVTANLHGYTAIVRATERHHGIRSET